MVRQVKPLHREVHKGINLVSRSRIRLKPLEMDYQHGWKSSERQFLCRASFRLAPWTIPRVVLVQHLLVEQLPETAIDRYRFAGFRNGELEYGKDVVCG